MGKLRPVKVVWWRLAKLPLKSNLACALSHRDMVKLQRKLTNSSHGSFRIRPGVILEIPSPGWGHGDFLVYLPARGWLVRRNYAGYWYVDIGVMRRAGKDQYAWTDLWLDLVCGKRGERHKILDVPEFIDAIRKGQVNNELAAYAMESLAALIAMVEAGRFPPPEVLEVERRFRAISRLA